MKAYKRYIGAGILLLSVAVMLGSCSTSRYRSKKCNCPAYGYKTLQQEPLQANQQTNQPKPVTDAS